MTATTNNIVADIIKELSFIITKMMRNNIVVVFFNFNILKIKDNIDYKDNENLHELILYAPRKMFLSCF